MTANGEIRIGIKYNKEPPQTSIRLSDVELRFERPIIPAPPRTAILGPIPDADVLDPERSALWLAGTSGVSWLLPVSPPGIAASVASAGLSSALDRFSATWLKCSTSKSTVSSGRAPKEAPGKPPSRHRFWRATALPGAVQNLKRGSTGLQGPPRQPVLAPRLAFTLHRPLRHRPSQLP
jgi:hypothetical protein